MSTQPSTGPLIGEDHALSYRNNLRHGFRSQSVLLPGDDPAEYDSLLAELAAHFGPEDLTEHRFIREMADAEWRLRRIRASLESALTRRIVAISAEHPDAGLLSPQASTREAVVRGPNDVDIQSRAIETLGTETGTSYGTWLRYETKFERQYERACKDWTRYQNDRRTVSAKEADIWMQKAVFAPLPPGTSPETTPVVGLNARAQLRALSAQVATRAAVVRGSEELASTVQNPPAAVVSAQGATRVPVGCGSHQTRSSVQSGPSGVPGAQPATRAGVVSGQIARSAPCPCGSGEKYKRCCGRTAPPVLGVPLSEAA